MSRDEVIGVYTKYGKSTKRESEDQIGYEVIEIAPPQPYTSCSIDFDEDDWYDEVC